MKKTVIHIFALLLICLPSGILLGQSTAFKPDIRRVLNHEKIDEEQKIALQSDGKKDSLFSVTSNDEINFLITSSLINGVNELQNGLETDSLLSHPLKLRYIVGLQNILKNINSEWKADTIYAINLPSVLDNFKKCIALDRSNINIAPTIETLPYEVGDALIKCRAFELNDGYAASKDILIKKYCNSYPEQTFYKLRENPDLPYADSLIKVAGNRFPSQLYDYAAANNKLAYRIRKVNDPLVQTVAKIATASRSGQWYFPFLDNIMHKKMAIEDIDAVRDDSIKYYKLLVRTKIDYTGRAIQGDTAIGYHDLDERLQLKARDVFVNTINGLHELSDAVRFRIIQPLSAEELYYCAVLSDGLIYTSSYVKGVYPLMMQKVNQKPDSLLQLIKFDRFRKFIKMAAGYNTLNDFLSKFYNQENAEILMTAFVNSLEKSEGLEDGVDVADSYSSIVENNKPLADHVLELTKANYTRNILANNKRGMVMYDLLYKLFLSADTTSNVDLSKEFGIPPVYSVSHQSLENDKGEVVMQVMFYGDQDGKNIFNGFQHMFSSANWKITPSAFWINITSLKGKPVTIFANRPLDEETGDDEKAQTALNEYLAKNGLKPTVIIHRGHSYYADYTIKQILPTARIVFMGSCGGYHLINDILERAPDAHIIASKQIGKTAINRPFFDLLMEKMRNGSNIDWIPFWKEFDKNVYVEGFEDYIPPHKNLGAIFIKAYKIAMGSSAPLRAF